MTYSVPPSVLGQGNDETGSGGNGGGDPYPNPQPGDPGKYTAFLVDPF
jgi:hypothetical protein